MLAMKLPLNCGGNGGLWKDAGKERGRLHKRWGVASER